MTLYNELLIQKPLDPGQETILSVLLTREYLSRLLDENLFKSEGITDQQYNVLRILKGGPPEGYLIREIRGRMIARNADVPRLVDRLVAQALVRRTENPMDRRGCLVQITSEGMALEARVAGPQMALSMRVNDILAPDESKALWSLLERLRTGIQELLAEYRLDQHSG